MCAEGLAGAPGFREAVRGNQRGDGAEPCSEVIAGTGGIAASSHRAALSLLVSTAIGVPYKCFPRCLQRYDTGVLRRLGGMYVCALAVCFNLQNLRKEKLGSEVSSGLQMKIQFTNI